MCGLQDLHPAPVARRATTVRADRVTSRRVPRESTRWPPAPRRPASVRTARRASTHWAGLRNAQSVEQERIRPRGVPHLKVRAHNAQRTRFLRHWERGHQIPVHPARRGKTQCRGVPTVRHGAVLEARDLMTGLVHCARWGSTRTLPALPRVACVPRDQVRHWAARMLQSVRKYPLQRRRMLHQLPHFL